MNRRLAVGLAAAVASIVPIATSAAPASAASTAPSGCYSCYWNFSQRGRTYIVYTDAEGTSRVVSSYHNEAV